MDAPPNTVAWHRSERAEDGSVLAYFAPAAARPFDALARGAAPFMHSIVTFIETTIALHHYKMTISSVTISSQDAGLPAAVLLAAQAAGFVVRVEGRAASISAAPSDASASYAPPLRIASGLIDFHTANGQHVFAGVTNEELCIARGALGGRCYLDAKARPCYVAVHSVRFVRRLSELSSAERDDIWITLLDVLREQHGGAFTRIELNAGSFQNVAHLHIKAFVPRAAFDAANRHRPAFARLCATLRVEERVDGNVGNLFWSLLHGPRALRECAARLAPRVRRRLVGVDGDVARLTINRIPTSVRVAPNAVDALLLPLAFWCCRIAGVAMSRAASASAPPSAPPSTATSAPPPSASAPAPPRRRRAIIGIAGAAASGKSTLSALLVEVFNALAVPAAVLSMDAYHLPNTELSARGLRAAKGRPETIDSAALLGAVQQLRDEPERAHLLPDYDRLVTHDPLPGALRISTDVRVVLVEGLYICRGARVGEDTSVWARLRALLDATVYINVAESVARERIVARRAGDGGEAAVAAAHAHYDACDLPTAREMAKSDDAAGATLVLNMDDSAASVGSYCIARAIADRCSIED